MKRINMKRKNVNIRCHTVRVKSDIGTHVPMGANKSTFLFLLVSSSFLFYADLNLCLLAFVDSYFVHYNIFLKSTPFINWHFARARIEPLFLFAILIDEDWFAKY